ncbi:phage holin family protein [Proteiniborus sp. MB09-C3]|uniref:phage holin family protein n=1 Tax=Proteiniborus sp. MB09-C3 TaxID=3050072 RepID=UPI0025563206|nr:phage holin family protein [Proteiniborus sp. MB09-C3]WIV12300.1 phage holin family protein [Proteiniborus sp. MB09-C3]
MPDDERNNDRNNERTRDNKDFSITEMIVRVIITAIVVGLTAFFTPGFSVDGLWSLLIASIVIGILDYLVERFTGMDASAFGKGIKGFLITVVILYVTRLIVPGFHVTWLGAIIGAIVIGIIDMIIPSRASI